MGRKFFRTNSASSIAPIPKMILGTAWGRNATKSNVPRQRYLDRSTIHENARLNATAMVGVSRTRSVVFLAPWATMSQGSSL